MGVDIYVPGCEFDKIDTCGVLSLIISRPSDS
jgi:hypothetical protein